MNIKATFCGMNNSMGYINGKEYELILHGTYISRVEDGGGICPYSSILAFFKNWTNIKTLK